MKKLLLVIALIVTSAMAKDTFIGKKEFKTKVGTSVTILAYASMFNSNTGRLTLKVSEKHSNKIENITMKFNCEGLNIDDMKSVFENSESTCHLVSAN